MPRMWMRHVTHTWDMSHTHETCHTHMRHVTHTWDMSHTHMRHVPRIKEWCHAYQGVVSRIWRGRVTHERGMSHTQAQSDFNCNTLQHTARHCNTLHHTVTHCNTVRHSATPCNTLQHTRRLKATAVVETLCAIFSLAHWHCNTLQHTVTHFSTLQHTAIHCNTLQHSATLCNTLQHSTAHCDTLQHTPRLWACVVLQCVAVCCSVLQCLAVSCGELQCVATAVVETLFWRSSVETTVKQRQIYLSSKLMSVNDHQTYKHTCTHTRTYGNRYAQKRPLQQEGICEYMWWHTMTHKRGFTFKNKSFSLWIRASLPLEREP